MRDLLFGPDEWGNSNFIFSHYSFLHKAPCGPAVVFSVPDYLHLPQDCVVLCVRIYICDYIGLKKSLDYPSNC